MEPYHILNAKDKDHESEEILDLLPFRFREISGSSTAMESFNLMNDDLISHRIIPALDSRVRTLITNARTGIIANRLRHLVDAAPPSPNKHRLLFRVIPSLWFGDNVSEIKFIDCAIRDKRLHPFPQHEFSAFTIPHWMPAQESHDGSPKSQGFVEVIGHKLILWNSIGQQDPFCYILNLGHNSDMVFRALDTSTIVREIHGGFLWVKNVTVGERLIVLLFTPRDRGRMLSFDVNTERWSVLPECPQVFHRDLTPIPWKGKLYLAVTEDPTDVVPMHFDFQRNMWVVGGSENTAFARRLTSFPKYSRSPRFVVTNFFGRCIISSKSGTLYAISQRSDTQDTNGDYGELYQKRI